VVFGIFALLKTDVDEFPDISAPVVFVAVAYPGASPQQVEREVVDRMEEQFNAISGLDKINSYATDGFAQIVVQFASARTSTRRRRRSVTRSPRSGQAAGGDAEPIIKKFDPNDQADRLPGDDVPDAHAARV